MTQPTHDVASRREQGSRPPAAPMAVLTPSERAELGKKARVRVRRDSHALADFPADRADPVSLLEKQAVTRVPELVPARYGRMLISPFTFFRGAALPMASDLARTPVSGLTVQACGDAHLSNFGIFGSPERRLVFDVNDFDETLPGPWEWDVKRLAASLEVAARENQFTRKQRAAIVLAAVGRSGRRFGASPSPATLRSGTRTSTWSSCARTSSLSSPPSSARHGTKEKSGHGRRTASGTSGS
jgi:Uncharacterized protein conserved in bacteria (DUF2252)